VGKNHPTRGEGKHIEIYREIPSPLMGEGQGGGENGIFSHLQNGEGGIYRQTFPSYKHVCINEALSAYHFLRTKGTKETRKIKIKLRQLD